MAGCNGGLHNWSRSFNFRTVGAQLAKLSPMLLAKEKREAGNGKGRERQRPEKLPPASRNREVPRENVKAPFSALGAWPTVALMRECRVDSWIKKKKKKGKRQTLPAYPTKVISCKKIYHQYMHVLFS